MTDKTGGGEESPPNSKWSKKDKQALGRVLITLGALAVCLKIGTGVVVNGVVFGLLIFVAVYVAATRIPGADTAMKKAGGLLDILVTAGTFIILGGSVTAMVAAATAGCLFTVMVSAKRWSGGQQWLNGVIDKAEGRIREHVRNRAECAAGGPDSGAGGSGSP